MNDADVTDEPDESGVRPLPGHRPATWVRIQLTADEALIISDWIYGLQNADDPVGDEAVWPAFYALNGAFESTSALVFAPDYGERLKRARARVRAGRQDHAAGFSPVGLSADQAVVLAHWLRDLSGGAGPLPEETVWLSLRRIGDIIETKGVGGMSLSAARTRLLATMGRNPDGIPFEEVPGHRPACDATRLRLGSVLRDG